MDETPRALKTQPTEKSRGTPVTSVGTHSENSARLEGYPKIIFILFKYKPAHEEKLFYIFQYIGDRNKFPQLIGLAWKSLQRPFK